jgi:hypothetical protein
MNFYALHMPKVKLSSYYSCHHTIGAKNATNHGFHCLNSQRTRQWTLFHETSCGFLKSLEPLLFLVEEILIIVLLESDRVEETGP